MNESFHLVMKYYPQIDFISNLTNICYDQEKKTPDEGIPTDSAEPCHPLAATAKLFRGTITGASSNLAVLGKMRAFLSLHDTFHSIFIKI